MKRSNEQPLLAALAVLSLALAPGCGNEASTKSFPPDAEAPAAVVAEVVEELPPGIALVVHGVLVDESGAPMPEQNMALYLAERETTLDTGQDESTGGGISSIRRIEGTGTLNLSIVGLESGGAFKLIDGKVVNPHAKTDEAGRFRFEASTELLEGETSLIVARQRPAQGAIGSESVPMIDENGEPVILRIEEGVKVLDLGHIRTLDG